MAATLPGQAGNLPYAMDRAPLRVTRQGSEVKVEAYEWVATHDLGAGGCLPQVHLNIDVDLLGSAGGATVNQWCERCDPHPQVEVAQPDERQSAGSPDPRYFVIAETKPEEAAKTTAACELSARLRQRVGVYAMDSYDSLPLAKPARRGDGGAEAAAAR